MKAMILAAGIGTRLRPLTDSRPKALVEINGRTLLEITLSRLRSFGVREVIVNVFHFADMIQEYLQANGNFGMRVEISREDVLLDTGGGLKKASHFFMHDDEPFILHNVDVLSSIDLQRMVQFHVENHALATLFVQDRKTSRYLLFDQQQLRGRQTLSERESGPPQNARQSPATTRALVPLAFCGIQVISPEFLERMSEEGAFSIIDTYLRLASEGEKILAFRADEYYWRDLGKPEAVAQAAQDLKEKVIAL